MYKFVNDISIKEHDEYIYSNKDYSLLNLSNWLKVKDNWNHKIVGVYEDDRLVISCLLLIKKVIFNFNFIYIPRGPVLDYKNEDLLFFFFKSLKEYAYKNNVIFIKFDPELEHKRYLKDDYIQNDINQELNNLKNINIKYLGLSKHMADTIQPRFNAYVDEENDYYNEKIKRHINYAKKHFVSIIRVNKEGLDDFIDILKRTEKRKKISLRNKEYYEKLLDIYLDDAYLLLANIDIDKNIKELLKEKSLVLDKLERSSSQKKKEKYLKDLDIIENNLKEFSYLKDKYGSNKIIAGSLSIRYGDKMDMLYNGMNEDFKKYFGQYYLYFYTFELAKKIGVKRINLGGVENDLNGGLYNFKNNFNPTIIEYIGEFDLVINKALYYLFNLAYKIKKSF